MSSNIYDFSTLTGAVHSWLSGMMSSGWVTFTEMVIIGILFLAFYALMGLFLVYAERKVCAFMQIRLGPNRVGKWGIIQTVADALKLLIKEIIPIRKSDKFLFNLAPFIVIIVSFMTLGAIPFARGLQGIDLNIGVFYMMAVTSLGVIGILLAGWSSNSKYSLMGAIRSGAQMVSYELSIGLSLLAVVVLTGTMQLSGIIESQADGWWIFKGHIPAIVAFIIFLIASTAELNRGPFDLAEADSELAAGFHTEYSGMQFAMFFLAEYVNMFIVSALGATVFLGGWMPLHIGNWEGFNQIMDYIPSMVWFFLKSFFLIYVIMWFKWTFPRLRIDQLLTLEWKYLLPISLLNIVIVAFITLMNWHF
jgi:NADH-quinone oxidoreductase subunit H